MITEDYVSFGVAKLLKDKGFKEWCRNCYGLDVRHNGESIDVDEEYELKDAGRENEIEYVDGGRMYDYGCGNFNPGSPYAAPSLYVAMKWLREVHGIDISIDIRFWTDDEGVDVKSWRYTVYRTDEIEDFGQSDTYEEACEEAIKYCLEKLI